MPKKKSFQYKRNNQRLKTEKGKQAKAKRQSTVEPVFGTLTQYLGMLKVNVRVLAGSNKGDADGRHGIQHQKTTKIQNQLCQKAGKGIGFVLFEDKVHV